MKFVKVDEVPKKRYSRKGLCNYWEEFMRMDVKIVKVELSKHDYASPRIAQSTFVSSIKKYGYPIDVMNRNGEIYLVRRDM
jgi:hypothetical protein